MLHFHSVKISIFAASLWFIAHLTADSMGLSSLKFLHWAPKDASFLQSSAYRPFKVIQGRWFWYQSKACIWYFLLVRHSNQGPIISDMLQLTGWKLQIFPILLSCGAPLRMFYLELRGEVYTTKKLTNHGAILQWRPHDRSMSPFDTVPAGIADGRTDRQTDLL